MRIHHSFLSLLCIVALYLSTPNFTIAQEKSTSSEERLLVFLDCSSTYCDTDFIRTEFNIIDFSRDNQKADVHILINSARNASEGETFEIIIYGQGEFSNYNDTLRFDVAPNSTDFERRDILLKHIKIAAFPLLVKRGLTDVLDIQILDDRKNGEESSVAETEDPWNYWVYRVSGDGFINSDQNYKSVNLYGSVSANRTTEHNRTYFRAHMNKSINEYNFFIGNEQFLTRVENSGWALGHGYNKMLTNHVAVGYTTDAFGNTFTNQHRVFDVSPGIEYSLFPYSDFNTKFVTMTLKTGMQHLKYDTLTVYGFEQQWVPYVGLNLSAQFSQKWGNFNTNIRFRNYLHNTDFYSVKLYTNFDIRITGGLFIRASVYGGLINDQLSVEAGTINPEDVFTRRRLLLSNFNLGANFGISYRFGSLLNNFVNPSFGGS